LRADVFQPLQDGKYPAILSYGPYGKGLAFEDLYKTCWDRMAEDYPDVPAGSTNKYQNWEVADPEKWVPEGYVCVRVDSRGCGRSPGCIDLWSPREARDFYNCIEWAGVQPWSNGKVAREARWEDRLVKKQKEVRGYEEKGTGSDFVCSWAEPSYV
jgi:uncharacterized protein